MGSEGGHAQRQQVLAVCCLSLVMVVLAVSSLNIALPSMQRGLGASATQLLWIVDVYALVFAGTLLPAGALGDRFGRKGALLLGLAIFATASVGAGLANEGWQVITARAVMGVGAGFVMPATLSTITTVYPPDERAKAIAVWAGFAGAGGALGPVTSGLVLKVWDWSAVFFIMVPVAAMAFVLVALRVPASRDPAGTRLDPVGALVSVLGLFALLLGTIEGPEKGWTSPLVLGAYVAAGVLLTLFVWWELRVPHPMLDPRYFSLASFRNGSVTITAMFFAMFGMFFLVAQFLQYVKGYTPLAAGVALLPAGISFIVLAPRGPAIAARIGSYPTIAIGMFAAACGFVVLSIVGESTPYVWLAVALVLMTGGGALAMPPSTAAIVSSLPPAKAGVGSAVNDVTREVGGALGIAVLGSIASALYRSDISSTADRLPAGLGARVEESVGSAMAAAGQSDAAAAAAEQARDAFASATSVGYMVAAVLMLIGSAGYFRLHRACVRRSLQAPAPPTTEQAALAGIPACR